jgi:aminopeptidase-like protein
MLNNHDEIGFGQKMYQLISELFPICRSITGEGFRRSLRILQQHIPLQLYEVPSGTAVYDWTVPREWNIRDAYLKNEQGKKVIDFNESNLHIMSYSSPIQKKMSLSELKPHLFTIPDRPDWIPYRTSYYAENWGFCLSQRQFETLEDGIYEVFIDSSLEDGNLTYGEFLHRGQTDEEVLISCHSCHPSLCNDNLTGMALATCLAKYLSQFSLRYSYRFIFIPATIGSITWLSLNESQVPSIKHGLVMTCVGDPGKLTYKKSRQGDAEIDKAVSHVLKNSGQEFEIIDFYPYGYDERQYCSPGFDLPVGSLTRSSQGRYPEYHTSADNLEFIKPEYLANSFSTYLRVINILENNRKYINKQPKCEPQLGKRGLYGALGGKQNVKESEFAMLWVLNFSDGRYSLLDIAEKSNLKFELIQEAATTLVKYNLLDKITS